MNVYTCISITLQKINIALELKRNQLNILMIILQLFNTLQIIVHITYLFLFKHNQSTNNYVDCIPNAGIMV